MVGPNVLLHMKALWISLYRGQEKEGWVEDPSEDLPLEVVFLLLHHHHHQHHEERTDYGAIQREVLRPRSPGKPADGHLAIDLSCFVILLPYLHHLPGGRSLAT